MDEPANPAQNVRPHLVDGGASLCLLLGARSEAGYRGKPKRGWRSAGAAAGSKAEAKSPERSVAGQAAERGTERTARGLRWGRERAARRGARGLAGCAKVSAKPKRSLSKAQARCPSEGEHEWGEDSAKVSAQPQRRSPSGAAPAAQPKPAEQTGARRG
jgi:hypothetical protein